MMHPARCAVSIPTTVHRCNQQATGRIVVSSVLRLLAQAAGHVGNEPIHVMHKTARLGAPALFLCDVSSLPAKLLSLGFCVVR
jgi:hypothetical protein